MKVKSRQNRIFGQIFDVWNSVFEEGDFFLSLKKEIKDVFFKMLQCFCSFQPLLCEVFYTLIEYGKTTMFLWMFIEGIILYHMTTVAYSRGPEHQNLFYVVGWGKSQLAI